MTPPVGDAMPAPEDPRPTPRRQPDRNRPDDDEARAQDIYDEVVADDPDPITRREAVEGELEDEGLSEAGETLGEHNE
jgi:hypothetical protein